MTEAAPILAKVAMALLTGGTGYWLWHSANEWKAKGEIPAIWDESNMPVKAGERGFAAFVIWQKALSALSWLFCALCVASIVLSNLLGLF